MDGVAGNFVQQLVRCTQLMVEKCLSCQLRQLLLKTCVTNALTLLHCLWLY